MSRTHPEHWRSYTGPANWYQIWYPPGWQLEEGDGLAELVSPDGHGRLSLNCFWLSEPKDVELAAVLDVESLFPRSRNVQHINPLDVPYRSFGLEGESPVSKRPPWWKHLLEKTKWRRWRIWAVQQQSVCLAASLVQTGEFDPELRTLSVMILNTLRLADEPADPPRMFAERVLKLARERFPLLKCEQSDEFQLQLGGSNINLFNFYRSYVSSPEKFEEILLPALTTVVQVQEWGTQQTEPPLERVRERIMPMLYPESVWRESFPNFVGAGWLAGQMILYVVDESNAYWYIRNDLLKTWNLTPEELHRLALENLETYFDNNEMEFILAGETGSQQVLMPNRPDAYNASRLLSPAFHRKLREVLGGEVVVGIPSRDFCVAVSLDSGEIIEQVRRQVREDYAQRDHPLCERLLLISSDGVSEYMEEGE